MLTIAWKFLLCMLLLCCRLFWKVIQITFSQVSILQPQGTCSCYSHSNCPDIAQKTFQSGVDRVNPGVLLDFSYWICFITVEIQTLKCISVLNNWFSGSWVYVCIVMLEIMIKTYCSLGQLLSLLRLKKEGWKEGRKKILGFNFMGMQLSLR